MALISSIPALDVANAAARALEQLLGHDVILTTGPPAFGAPNASVLPDDPTRAVALPFANGVVGELTLVVNAPFGALMEAAVVDADLASAAIPVLQSAADTIERMLGVGANPEWAGEISTETLLTTVGGDFVTIGIFDNETRIAAIVVRVVDEEPAPAAPPPARPPSSVPAPAQVVAPTPVAALPPRAPMTIAEPAAVGAGVASYQFQPLSDGTAGNGSVRSVTLLNEVNMEVIAELGRRRLKVRDIMALEPGSVIELDKTAGSPVDVLVNGALVWHGEVVVVDEEFGIRVSEIVMDES